MSLNEVIEKSKDLRQDNKYLKLLELIWKSPGIARRDIGAQAKLSKGAVTTNITQLIEDGYVMEGASLSENENRLGRSTSGLYVKSDFFYTIGISIFSIFEAVLFDASGKAIRSYRNELTAKDDESYLLTLEELRKSLASLMKSVPRAKIISIGIACPGIVDFDKGDVFFSGFFKGAKEFNLKKFVSEIAGIDPLLINISHLRPIIEKRWGGAKNMNTFITVDDSCAAGFFLNGELFRGWQKHAGELSFMKVSDSPEMGDDGRNGLIGTKALFYLLCDHLKKLVANGGRSKITEFMSSPDDDITMELIVRAIEAGDKYLELKMAERYGLIAEAVINTVYMLNPEAVFLEKWTARCPQCTRDIVERKMSCYGQSGWHLRTQILSSQCSDRMIPQAAAYLAAETVFKDATAGKCEE